MPRRGEIWMVDLNPTRGHEQAGLRPALVVSVDPLNQGPAALAIVVPITGTDRGIPLHVPIRPPEGGLDRPSFLLTEQVRSISRTRFVRRRGLVEAATLSAFEDGLRLVLGL